MEDQTSLLEKYRAAALAAATDLFALPMSTDQARATMKAIGRFIELDNEAALVIAQARGEAIRTTEEITAILAAYPYGEPRWCHAWGGCGCMGCVQVWNRTLEQPITQAEFALWEKSK